MIRDRTASTVALTHRLRRGIHRHQRLLACLLLSAAAGVVVEALVGNDAVTTTPVLTAARDLPVGAVLTEADVTVVDLPDHPGLRDTFRVAADVVAQQLASPVTAGSPIAGTSLVGDALLTGTPPGTVAVPLRPSDPSTVQLLTPGQTVDVILSTGNGYDVATDTSIVARSVAVLWTAAPDSGQGAWGGADGDAGLVVVAAGADDAEDLAGASSSGDVHLVLTSDG